MIKIVTAAVLAVALLPATATAQKYPGENPNTYTAEMEAAHRRDIENQKREQAADSAYRKSLGNVGTNAKSNAPADPWATMRAPNSK